jgi:hypothetical protein
LFPEVLSSALAPLLVPVSRRAASSPLERPAPASAREPRVERSPVRREAARQWPQEHPRPTAAAEL